MSGGVDSSAAAGLLKRAGCRLFGITMRVRDEDASCIENARRVADALAVEHVVVDVRDEFKRLVVDRFCSEYLSGNTPNPCIECNRHIKFGALRRAAEERGADILATGHYARIAADHATGRRLLCRGADPKKDQSYFLYVLRREHLARTVTPLGEYEKEDVRRIAAAMHLPAARSRESQDICFIDRGGYGAFISRLCPRASSPGPVLNTSGERIGTHRGIAFYTVGQRRGIGIASSEPLYVLSVSARDNALTVGAAGELYTESFRVAGINWIAAEPPYRPAAVLAQIRYSHRPAEALVEALSDTTACVKLAQRQKAVTPGQSAVFYDQGNRVVLGGGTIVL